MSGWVVFFAVVATALAGVQFGPCSDERGEAKQPGDTWYESNCTMVTCGQSPGGEVFMEWTRCYEPKVEAPCEMSQKPYETRFPDCCPYVKCIVSDNTNSNYPYIWNAMGHGRK